MELRKLDVLQATSHVKMLLSFMPDAFLGRGGKNMKDEWFVCVNMFCFLKKEFKKKNVLFPIILLCILLDLVVCFYL